MGIISWIFVGLVAGALGKLLMPGKDPAGFFVTIIIGILGGLLGGFIGSRLLGWGSPDGFNLSSIGIATLGSILLLFLYRLVKKK